MYDEQKYKMIILSMIEEQGLYSVMNNTKWQRLKSGIEALPFAPPFVMKRVDEEEIEYHKFDKDVCYLGDWGSGLDRYLGSDIYATPFYVIEWIKVRPRYLRTQGRLIPAKIIDATEQFETILKNNNIPYEEHQGAYLIFGYRK